MKRINANTFVGVGFAAFGAFLLYQAGQLRNQDEYGPSTFPKLVAIVMIACGLMLAVQSILSKNVPKPEWDKNSLLRILILTVLLVVYLIVMPRVGFIICTIILVAAALWLFNMRDIKLLVILSAMCPTVLYFLFAKLLNVPLP